MHKSSVSTGFAGQIMPILHILCCNGSLVTWTVVSLTTAKFKPLIFYLIIKVKVKVMLRSTAPRYIYSLGTDRTGNAFHQFCSSIVAIGTCLFEKPLFSNGCCIFDHLVVVAQQRIYMPLYITHSDSVLLAAGSARESVVRQEQPPLFCRTLLTWEWEQSPLAEGLCTRWGYTVRNEVLIRVSRQVDARSDTECASAVRSEHPATQRAGAQRSL
jgi:hypothetical protein